MSPKFLIGANTDERAPNRIFISSFLNFCHTLYFSASVIELCQIPTEVLPNLLIVRAVSCDTRAISGARKSTFLPSLIVSSISLK